MKILITGANGQLGNEMALALERRLRSAEVVLTDVDSLDITDADAVKEFLDGKNFTHLVNCAAYTAVDRAEEQKSLCLQINVDAVTNIGRYAALNDIRVVHISTDYVFDGKACTPYCESDRPDPRTHYGATKRKSETVLLGLVPDAVIVRTGWLYSSFGNNFVKTMLRLARTHDSVNVVYDQVGTPTYAADLADMIVTIISAPQWLGGTYHFSNEGVASWYDFAHAIFSLASPHTHVVPVSTREYGVATERPHYSVLDKSKIKATFGVTIPHWMDALKRCLAVLEL